MGNCVFDLEVDGDILRVLSDPSVATLTELGEWTPASVLDDVIAGGEAALIDCGALIKGFSNDAVAAKLGAGAKKPVAFISVSGEHLVLDGDVSVPLAQSGVKPADRLTFYDHVHTTGTDIKQAPTARAAITVGKDTTFRDFAQGAYRMRQIGQGQKLRVIAPPEVTHAAGRTLEDVLIWLLRAADRAEQDKMLLNVEQQFGMLWRRPAFEALEKGQANANSALIDKAHRAANPAGEGCPPAKK